MPVPPVTVEKNDLSSNNFQRLMYRRHIRKARSKYIIVFEDLKSSSNLLKLHLLEVQTQK